MTRMSDKDLRDAFDPFYGVDYMLPAEDEERYDELVTLMEEELQPSDTTERFWVQDLVTLRWEKLRYEKFKLAVFARNHDSAVASILEKVYLHEALVGGEKIALATAKMDAEKLRKDPDGCDEIVSRLVARGFDTLAINAETFLLSAPAIEILDRRTAAVQSREMKLLREFGSRREFARRARLLLTKVIDSSFSTAKPEQTA